jgi:hypothetical protein
VHLKIPLTAEAFVNFGCQQVLQWKWPLKEKNSSSRFTFLFTPLPYFLFRYHLHIINNRNWGSVVFMLYGTDAIFIYVYEHSLLWIHTHHTLMSTSERRSVWSWDSQNWSKSASLLTETSLTTERIISHKYSTATSYLKFKFGWIDSITKTWVLLNGKNTQKADHVTNAPTENPEWLKAYSHEIVHPATINLHYAWFPTPELR